MTINEVLEHITRIVGDERYPPPLKVWLVNKTMRLAAQKGPDHEAIAGILADSDQPREWEQ